MAPIFAYTKTFTWVILFARTGKIQKNTSGLFILEWSIWAIVIPLLYILIFFYAKTTSEYSFSTIWNSYAPLIKTYIVGTVFFVWFIAAPLLGFVGVITRPLAKRNKQRRKFEIEKIEVIKTINRITRKY